MRIRWEDVSLRIFVDDAELANYPSVNVSFDEQIEVDRAKYQGESSPRLDGHYNGVSGSIEYRLEDGFGDPDDVFQIQKGHLRDRTPGGVVRLQVARREPGTTTRKTFVIRNAILQPSTRAAENMPWAYTQAFDGEDLSVVTA